LHTYAYAVSGINVAQLLELLVTGDISFIGLFAGVPWRGSVK